VAKTEIKEEMKENLSRLEATSAQVSTAESVTSDVLAHIRFATQAVRRQDMAGMTEGLAAAVDLYELYPSHVHMPASHLPDLLLCIRSGRTLCSALGRPDRDLGALEARAEALRHPLH
jgi:hypothetical protein